MTNKCPNCKSPLNLKPPLEINQSVICSNCGLELEVIWLYPLELAKVLSDKPRSIPAEKNEAEVDHHSS